MSGEVAKQLSNYGNEKFVEDAHGQSVWTVLPINHILGKLLLTPANSKPWKCTCNSKTLLKHPPVHNQRDPATLLKRNEKLGNFSLKRTMIDIES